MTHEHDTVVVAEREGRSMGAILGVIAIIYFALGPGAGSSGNTTNGGSGGSGTGDQPAATQQIPNPVSS